MPFYDPRDLFDKLLYTKKKVNAYDRPGGKIVKTFDAGQNAGKIYSFIHAGDASTLWWEMYPEYSVYYGYNYWLKNDADSFDKAALEDQGVLNIKQKEEARKEKEEEEGQSPFVYYGKKAFAWGLGAYIVTQIGKALINRKSS